MSRKFLHLTFLSAWLLASGGVWDIVQVVAWGRMFSHRLDTLPALEAARQTFLPGEKCNLCLAVEDGKKAQGESAGAAGTDFSSKVPLVIPAVTCVRVNPPDGVSRVRLEAGYARSWREVPPLPPPRV